MQKYALAFDTEADSFYDDATIMWTFCAKDMRTGKRWSFGGPEGVQPYKEDIQTILMNSDLIVCHNEIKHDLPLMAKLGIADKSHWGKAKIIDTFTLSSLLNPDRPTPPGCKGGHSLKAFGVLSGGAIEKVEQEVWHTYDPNMMTRCESDVDLTEYAYKYLCAEIAEDKWDWKEAFDLETKVAFIIAKQERDGWQFDVEGAKKLVAWIDEEIAKIDAIVSPMLPPILIPEDKAPKFPVKKFTKDGKPSSQALRYWKDEISEIAEKIGVSFEEAAPDFLRSGLTEKPKQFYEVRNPASQPQMKDFLLSIGWVPTQYTPKGAPKMTEDSLESIEHEAGKLVAKRFILAARRSLLQNAKNDEKGLLNLVRADGRIPALASPCATPTGRMRHKNVVNIPAGRSLLGHEIRSLFITKTVDGVRYKLVGCDAAGLELRNLASRMGDQRFIDMIVSGKKEEGTDVHTFFKNLLCEYIDTRDDAKTIEYAMIYGAGDEKLGKIAVRGPSDYAKRGKAVRAKIMKELPALDNLIQRVQKVAKRGFLKGLDGRKIWVRSEHAALNSLLQCDGALVMKVALTLLYKEATRARLDFTFVGNIHDEVQAEVHPDHAEKFAELARNSIRDAGVYLKMACPLEGESNIGYSWADTH